jgi:hypothetical protein
MVVHQHPARAFAPAAIIANRGGGVTRDEALREATTEELEVIGALIDDVALEAPDLLYGNGVWTAFVHEVLVELVARRNYRQLRKERDG